jgi:ubiquitin related modifier 1
LFDKIKAHDVTVDVKEGAEFTMREAIIWVKDNLLKERPEMFIQDDSVRPGILVLINDADWELEGTLDYKVQEKDTLVFISTLHGG